MGILTAIFYFFGEIPIQEVLFYSQFLDINQIGMFWAELICLFVFCLLLTYLFKKSPKTILCLIFCWGIGLGYIYIYPLFFGQEAKIFQKNYVLPKIKSKGKKKNIVLIFWESMEDTFSDKIAWGENLIPHMSDLENKSTTFKGYHDLKITRSTIKSQVATLCGIPFLDKENDAFLPRVKCISDDLKKQGYYQVYMKAADTRYTDANMFAKTHSFNEVLGKQDFLKKGIITKDDKMGWGIFDSVFMKLAKKKLIELSSKKKPFFLVLTTVNTHYPNGNTEKDCPVQYEDIRDNIKCSDQILFDFVDWFKKEKFADDTILIVMGDHPMFLKSRMKIEKILKSYPNRNTFNAIIKGDNQGSNIQKEYAQFDWAPTILEEAGFLLFPRHYGLGVSLMAPEKSIVEKYGQELLELLIKNSKKDFRDRFFKSSVP